MKPSHAQQQHWQRESEDWLAQLRLKHPGAAACLEAFSTPALSGGETMPLMIITQQTIHEGTASLIIYRNDRAYQVALIHPNQRLELLKDAQFWTYDAAHTRLQQEVRERTKQRR